MFEILICVVVFIFGVGISFITQAYIFRSLEVKNPKKDQEYKNMVHLLGRVVLDVDQQNGKIMNDTRRELYKWVNG